MQPYMLGWLVSWLVGVGPHRSRAAEGESEPSASPLCENPNGSAAVSAAGSAWSSVPAATQPKSRLSAGLLLRGLAIGLGAGAGAGAGGLLVGWKGFAELFSDKDCRLEASCCPACCCCGGGSPRGVSPPGDGCN